MRLYTREQIGLPTRVLSSDGSPRPRLADSLPGVTIHYTGSPRKYAYTSVEAVMSAIREIQSTFAKTKPFEYNYVFSQAGDVYEYAGDYRAAHADHGNAASAGLNNLWYGYLLLNGIGEPLTNGQIEAVEWWRSEQIGRGRLVGNCQTVPHYLMPGASTVCPGTAIRPDFAKLLTPYNPDEDDVIYRYKDTRYANEFAYPSGLTYAGEMVAPGGPWATLPLTQGLNDSTLEALCHINWDMNVANAVTTGKLVHA